MKPILLSISVLAACGIMATGCCPQKPEGPAQSWAWPSDSGAADGRAFFQAPADASSNPWPALARGQLAEVYAERAIYAIPDRDSAYIHIRIRNLTDRGIAVNLKDHERLIGPVSYQLADVPDPSPQPTEAGLSVQTVTGPLAERMIDAYSQDKLLSVGPRMAMDYYSDLPAHSRSEINRGSRSYLTILLAGDLVVTDGLRCERIIVADAPGTNRRVILPRSSKWQDIPDGSLLVLPAGPTLLNPQLKIP